MTGARAWLPHAGAATLAHAAVVAGAIWLGMGVRPVPVEEPVVLIDLPPLAAAASAPAAVVSTAAPAEPQAQSPITPPPVAASLPREFVAVPPPAQTTRPAPATAPARPAAVAPAAAANPAPTRVAEAPAAVPAAGPTASTTAGNDPRAKAQEADYFSQLSAHLNKRKRYPAEAKKARQQGVVTVRFTVHRDGSVTGSAIRKSSGHALLDDATLDLLQRVAPLPRFPKAMVKDSVTLSLPIDYSLQTS